MSKSGQIQYDFIFYYQQISGNLNIRKEIRYVWEDLFMKKGERGKKNPLPFDLPVKTGGSLEKLL